ncbi:MAG TPA: hypothetical protein VKQ54_05785 [Caulobacteraceae bacterium]|nr:hypothetical protein [Caulobacteraceae bacterium]
MRRLTEWGGAGAALAVGLAGSTASAQLPNHIPEETGGHASQYVDAVLTPAGDQTCTVLLSVARAGTLQPLTNGFQLAIDTEDDVDQPAPDYKIGWTDDGRTTFAGGHLREVTASLKNGVFTLPNAPKYFRVELSLGLGHLSEAVIQRQCFGPVTQLVHVVNNPDTGVRGGDWLWNKDGH